MFEIVWVELGVAKKAGVLSFPKPVAVPEFVIVAPDGIVILGTSGYPLELTTAPSAFNLKAPFLV